MPFLRAGFTPVNGDFAKKAEVLRREFEKVLRQVLRCNMFIMNYPLLIEHILREANHYIRLLSWENKK